MAVASPEGIGSKPCAADPVHAGTGGKNQAGLPRMRRSRGLAAGATR